VDAVKRPLVAVFTQRDTEILFVLNDVVCVTWGRRITDPTVHLFYSCYVIAFFAGWFIVHKSPRVLHPKQTATPQTLRLALW
jgi:hypothetical protein